MMKVVMMIMLLIIMARMRITVMMNVYLMKESTRSILARVITSPPSPLDSPWWTLANARLYCKEVSNIHSAIIKLSDQRSQQAGWQNLAAFGDGKIIPQVKLSFVTFAT